MASSGLLKPVNVILWRDGFLWHMIYRKPTTGSPNCQCLLPPIDTIITTIISALLSFPSSPYNQREFSGRHFCQSMVYSLPCYGIPSLSRVHIYLKIFHLNFFRIDTSYLILKSSRCFLRKLKINFYFVWLGSLSKEPNKVSKNKQLLL